MAWDVSFDPVDAEDAITWFADRLVLTRAQVEELTAALADRAFYVSAVAQLDLVTQVWDAIGTALKDGEDLEDFKARVTESLTSAWEGTVENPAARIETIFRTNVQSAYTAGRYKQATDEDTIADRPYWMFDAIEDDRTSEICEKCDGTVRPADDAWWKSHLPPLHFNCRSHFITLTGEQADKHGVAKKPPTIEADDGFGAPPGEDDWKAPRSDYPAPLWSSFKEKQP
jgi:SPP1 gp7 family putative phage head morphogenesis protein